MKIALLSDLHFGYAYNFELENDSFDNADEAIEKALDSDLILLCGDIFDIRAPKTQTWAKSLRILSKPLLKENTGVKLVSCTKELKDISKRTLSHLPVIAIHGNHERLSRGEQNTVIALENAGIVIHLHLNTIVFEKDGIKVAIHGMSSVPERYAKDVLYQWNPQPLPDCFNILVMHQNIEPYVYSPIEPPTLNTSNLPKGFNLIIDGHIHTHTMERFDNVGFIIPGSTVITQFQRMEAEIEKVMVKLYVGDDFKADFIPLESNRKFFYEEIKLNGMPVTELVEKRINDILFGKKFSKKPVIRIKISGKETDVIDRELRSLENRFSDKVQLIFAKDLESPELMQSLELLRNLKEQKLSIEEIGLNFLKKNLDELKFSQTINYNDLFDLLSEDDVDKAFDILVGEQKTLAQFGE